MKLDKFVAWDGTCFFASRRYFIFTHGEIVDFIYDFHEIQYGIVAYRGESRRNVKRNFIINYKNTYRYTKKWYRCENI